MNAQQWRVQIVPGDGLVVRVGATVLVGRPTSPAHETFLEQLRAVAEGAEAEQPGGAGRRVARKVAGLVGAAEEDDVPALAVLSGSEGGAVLLLVGDMDAEITDAAGEVERMSAREVSTWSDKVVKPGFRSIALGHATSSLVDPRSDLQAGAVSGGGILLVAAGRAASPPPMAPPLDAPTQAQAVTPEQVVAAAPPPGAPPVVSEIKAAGFVCVSLAEPLPDEELAPLPVLAPELESAVQVEGIVCSRGHFNDPTATYCATCGISMVHQTHNLVPGPRPPLGVVVIDDGTVFTLNGDYVLGREPEGSEDVQQGRAVPLPLDDPDATLSRVHAKIVLQGWDVRILDVGSANGTFVAPPGQEHWTRLVPDEPTTIAPGTRVTVGGRSLVFDSYRKQ